MELAKAAASGRVVIIGAEKIIGNRIGTGSKDD